MAETKPSILLDMSSTTENNEQQYVEIGSNIYLGTKDGIKYSLIQSPDSKFRLVEATSNASICLSDSSGSFETLKGYESPIVKSELFSESKEIKLISVKSTEPSPCKGQGDEFGNTVLSPHNLTSSFEKTDCSTAEKVKQGLTPENLNNSSLLTYTTLYPKQDGKQALTYYVSTNNSYNNYLPIFPSPVTIRPARGARKSNTFLTPVSPYTAVPRARRGGPRMRRPRVPVYQYTPQVLHSTPTSLKMTNFGNDSSLSLSGSSSSTLSSSSLTKPELSFEYPRVPNNTPTTPETDSSGNQKIVSLDWMPIIKNYSFDAKESHNANERYRRLRIKNACNTIKSSMPWLSERTDNATVFEEAVTFITFLRGAAGREYDAITPTSKSDNLIKNACGCG